MPLDAPVTIATLSQSFIWFLFDVCRKSRNWYQIETRCKLRTVFQPSFLEVTAVMFSSKKRVRDDRVLLDLLADKWTIHVLGSLCDHDHRRRFNAIRRDVPGLSQKSLAQCLRRLEKSELASRNFSISQSQVGTQKEDVIETSLRAMVIPVSMIMPLSTTSLRRVME